MNHLRYPLKNIVTYNGITILHYILGSAGIIIALELSTTAKIISILYFIFAFVQMYVLMPVMVCPNCIYTKKTGMLCISGLNVISRMITSNGDIKNFAKRGEGILCHNNLYLAAKIFPILFILPFLIINFSISLLSIFLGIVGLLLFRIFFIFTRIACSHCLSKNICPNAKSMGISEEGKKMVS